MSLNLRVAMGQMEVIPGRPDLNTGTMLEMIIEAKRKQADIIIFPEMAIPGYLLGDTWEQRSFLRDCEEYGRHVIKASTDICVIFGNVGVDWEKRGEDGRVRKYNSLFIALNGALSGGDNFPYPFRIKTLQPNYREFDDNRHFFSMRQLSREMGRGIEELLRPVNLDIDGKPVRLGCILCEDGWSDDYCLRPIEIINRNGPADLFVNISSSPFTLGKNNKRNRVFSRQVKDAGVPLVYVNNVGIQNNGKTVYTFDGCSTVYSGSGEIIHHCRPFTEEIRIVDLRLPGGSGGGPVPVPDDRDTESLYSALYYGTEKFLASVGIGRVVVGLSGGIDSAVSACLFANVLGTENVILVNMPSLYNSNTTRGLAEKTARNLGCPYTVIPIQESVDYTVRQLTGASICRPGGEDGFTLQVSSFVKENIQARDRSSRILAGIAASFGGGFSCNANKSEMTVGYSTLYGDLAGFFAPLADLWKHQVYDLAAHFNNCVFNREVIPRGIMDLVPSAELSPEQSVDEGRGDPITYPYHDYLFRAFVEHWDRSAPEEILAWYDEGVLEERIGCRKGIVAQLFAGAQDFISDLEKWWRLYTGIAVAKRIQAPPVLAVSRRAFGFDHREAQNGTYFTSGYLELKKKLLHS